MSTNKRISKSLFSIFLEGISFFFAGGKNPIKEYQKRYNSKSDADNIAADWYNVGNDIRVAYGKFKERAR